MKAPAREDRHAASPAPGPSPFPPLVTAAGRKPGPAGQQGSPVSAAGPGTYPDLPGAASPLGGTGAAVAVPGSPGEGELGTARTWVIKIPAGTKFLTSNHREYRYDRNRINRDLKILSATLARQQRIPRIERADIFFTYLPPPRRMKDRHPLASARVEDGSGLATTGKALIDGISGTRVIVKDPEMRAAGVLPDDTRKHVRWECYTLLDGTCPQGQLTMYIAEVPQ